MKKKSGEEKISAEWKTWNEARTTAVNRTSQPEHSNYGPQSATSALNQGNLENYMS